MKSDKYDKSDGAFIYIYYVYVFMVFTWGFLVPTRAPPKGAHGQIRANKGQIVTNKVIEK
jgi:hypothetical protein